MYTGWRARARRQKHFAAPQQPPADTGTAIAAFDVFYVATTIENDPLNRVVVGGLGFRGKASVEIATEGITLTITGEPPVFIAKAALRAVGRSTWTIDKAVEDGGLVRLDWTLGAGAEADADHQDGTDVDTYLRATDPLPLIAAIQQLLPISHASGTTGTTQ
jgi:hypothetical protein